MLRQTLRLARCARVTQRVKTGKFFSKYVNKDDERNGINALDRLLLIKPAILEENDEYDYDGMHEFDENVELDGEPDPRVRLSRKLLSLGRIYYRHIEGLPEWFTTKQAEICNNRTPAQVRRCLKDWMMKYDRAAIEKYARKPLIWGEKVPRIAKIGPIMAYGPEETVAYANYFMPSRFSITARVFNELKMVSPEFKPRRIVDFGCGPATAGAAAYSVWGPEGTSKYTGIDMSQSMIDAAKIMTRDTIPDSVFWDKSSEVIKRAEARQERFDLAVVSYALSDFVNDPTRRAAIQIMFELLDVGGYLVVIDQGNPKGSNMTRAARQLILDTFNNVNVDGKALCLETSTYLDLDKDAAAAEEEDEDSEAAIRRAEYNIQNAKKIAATQKVKKEQYTSLILPAPPGYSHDEIGAYVVAPCTHDKPCPLAEGAWCSFSQKV
jgi:SAM-dependent methyltransferase